MLLIAVNRKLWAKIHFGDSFLFIQIEDSANETCVLRLNANFCYKLRLRNVQVKGTLSSGLPERMSSLPSVRLSITLVTRYCDHDAQI